MKRLPASALYFALVMAVLLSLITGSVILYGQTLKQEVMHWDRSDRVTDNCFSGIALGLRQEFFPGSPHIIDLYKEERDSVALRTQSWGIFELLHSEAFRGNHRLIKSVMTGYPIDEHFSLYLEDRNKPLALCGNTYVSGPSYLPKSGVKRAYIEGKNYTGDQLIYGSVKTSERNLPELNKEQLQSLRNGLKGPYPEDSLITFSQLPDSLVRAFYDSPVGVQAQSTEAILDGYFEGQVRFYFPGKVRILATCELKDVVVFAQEIEVEEGAFLQAQLFATKDLHLEPQVMMEHPSALGLLNPEANVTQLQIESGCQVSGVVFLINEVQTIRKFSSLEIEEGASIQGQVYTNQDMSLKGKIEGQLWCKRLMLRTPSSIYENHLLGVELDVHKLPEDFLTGKLINYSNEKEIIQWLD